MQNVTIGNTTFSVGDKAVCSTTWMDGLVKDLATITKISNKTVSFGRKRLRLEKFKALNENFSNIESIENENAKIITEHAIYF